MAKLVESRPGISVPDHSAVGDSQGNGFIENNVKRLQGMARTLKITIESKVGSKLTSKHAILGGLFSGLDNY